MSGIPVPLETSASNNASARLPNMPMPFNALKEEPEPRLPVQVCVDGNESLKRLKNRGEADERAFDEPPYLSHERDVLPHKDEVPYRPPRARVGA